MPYKDPQKKREYDAKYSKLNRDAINKKAREWKKKNKDKVSESGKRYRTKNAEAIKQRYKDNYHDISARGKKYYENNKDRIREKAGAYYKKNRKKVLLQNLFNRYNITEDEYHALLKKQGEKCGICSVSQVTLCVDHCHATGVVRGLLCGNCNKGIGFLKDDMILLESAKKYLSPWSK